MERTTIDLWFGAFVIALAKRRLSSRSLIEVLKEAAVTTSVIFIIVVGGIGNLPGALLAGVFLGVAEGLTGLYWKPEWAPALSVVLNHQSMQAEMEQEVQVEVEMNAIAFGDVAKQLDRVKVDDIISVKGFLSRKNRFSQQPILHITQFKIS